MPLSRFEPLLSHKTSRATSGRERISKPSCFYHRKYSSISRFDRPDRWSTSATRPCWCSGRYKQLVWSPGSSARNCTCPLRCICNDRDSSKPGVGSLHLESYQPSNCSTFCCSKTYNSSRIGCSDYCSCATCCCLPPAKKPSSVTFKNADLKLNTTRTKHCDCWRKIVGCCSCPARDILYQCQLPSVIQPQICSCAWCRHNPRVPEFKPSCNCSGHGCTLCCRRVAASITSALRESSWLHEPFSSHIPVGKDYHLFDFSCFDKGFHGLCLSTSQGEQRLISSSRTHPCICCTCKQNTTQSPITCNQGLDNICVCPPWCSCKKEKQMAESNQKCPCCSYPLAGIIKPSTRDEELRPYRPVAETPECLEDRQEPTCSSLSVAVDDDFACPKWCTCKREHSKLRRKPEDKESDFEFRNVDDYRSERHSRFETVIQHEDSGDSGFVRDLTRHGKAEVLDSDSDDSFRTCAWIPKPHLNVDESDSDALSIIDSDDDLVRTSDSDSDIDLDCFGRSTFSPIRRGHSTTL